MTSHRNHLLLAAGCLLMASGSWGFQLLSKQQAAFPTRAPPPTRTRSNKWKSSSSRVLLPTPPTALGFRDSDTPDQVTVHDEDLYDTIVDMVYFLTLRVGMAMLRQQLLKRKQKEKGVELLLKVSRSSAQHRHPRQDNSLQDKPLLDNPLPFSVRELDALENTNRFARDNMAALVSNAEEVRLAQEEAVAETLELERQHSALNSSVGATLAVPEELDTEPAIPVIYEVASQSATETRSLSHKKEGDRLLELGDDLFVAEEASSVRDNNKNFAAVVPEVPSCISTDFGKTLDAMQDGILAQVKLESENLPILDDDSSVEVAPIDNAFEMIAAPVEEAGTSSPNESVAWRAVDSALLSVKAEKFAESKQRALLMARLEQEQRRR
jgi:hypothetical protein